MKRIAIIMALATLPAGAGIAMSVIARAWPVQFQQFDGQFEKVPDGQIRCLIILPKPMVDAIEGVKEHAQVAMSGYPAHDSRLILTCEVVND